MNLSRFGKTTRLINGVAAGAADATGSSVDMKGFGAATFFFLLGAINDSPAGGTVVCKIQQSNRDTSPEDWDDLSGASVTATITADNDVCIVEVDSPTERYLRPVIIIGTNSVVIDGCIAIQTKADAEPVTHDSTTVAGTAFVQAPAES